MWTALLSLTLACGSEEWAEKTLTDTTAGTLIHPADARQTSVEALRGRPVAAHDGQHLVATLTAYVLGFKLEADGDLHLVVADGPARARTMIVELPSDDCAEGSPWAEEMAKARADVLELLGAPGAVGRMRWLKHPVRVDFEGVLFFDHLHGQVGVAPNGVELHPVLRLTRTSRPPAPPG